MYKVQIWVYIDKLWIQTFQIWIQIFEIPIHISVWIRKFQICHACSFGYVCIQSLIQPSVYPNLDFVHPNLKCLYPNFKFPHPNSKCLHPNVIVLVSLFTGMISVILTLLSLSGKLRRAHYQTALWCVVITLHNHYLYKCLYKTLSPERV